METIVKRNLNPIQTFVPKNAGGIRKPEARYFFLTKCRRERYAAGE